MEREEHPGPRLLVVDPDPAVHELLSEVLRRDGRRVHNAYEAREAVEHLRGSAFDVIVAGNGPDGRGSIALLRRARAASPNTRVILAGELGPEEILAAVRHGAYGYFRKPLSPSSVGEMVQQALGATSWRDDIRVISARPEWITLDVRSKLEAAERAACYLRELHAGLDPRKRDDIVVAFRELMMNAIEHGARSDPHTHVRVSAVRASRAVIVTIQDPGPGFSMDLIPHAAVSNPEDSPTRHVEVRAEHGQRPGGFGILMARNLVDDLLYNERGNAVMFVKYL